MLNSNVLVDINCDKLDDPITGTLKEVANALGATTKWITVEIFKDDTTSRII